jgi:hypothetical protein
MCEKVALISIYREGEGPLCFEAWDDENFCWLGLRIKNSYGTPKFYFDDGVASTVKKKSDGSPMTGYKNRIPIPVRDEKITFIDPQGRRVEISPIESL